MSQACLLLIQVGNSCRWAAMLRDLSRPFFLLQFADFMIHCDTWANVNRCDSCEICELLHKTNRSMLNLLWHMTRPDHDMQLPIDHSLILLDMVSKPLWNISGSFYLTVKKWHGRTFTVLAMLIPFAISWHHQSFFLLQSWLNYPCFSLTDGFVCHPITFKLI